MPEGYRKHPACQIRSTRISSRGMLPDKLGRPGRRALKRKAISSGQDSGRGRARPATCMPRLKLWVWRDDLTRRAAVRTGEILQHLQNHPAPSWLTCGRDRLANDGRGDHEPDPAVPMLVRPWAARAMIRSPQGGVVPSARASTSCCRYGARHGAKAMAQASLNRWWWPVAMMFGAQRQGLDPLGPDHGLGHQAHLQTTICARNSSTPPPYRRPELLGPTIPTPT